jgi:hypothetical protein
MLIALNSAGLSMGRPIPQLPSVPACHVTRQRLSFNRYILLLFGYLVQKKYIIILTIFE